MRQRPSVVVQNTKSARSLWTVCAKDPKRGIMRSLSYHDRREDAVARATTILGSLGGSWIVVNDRGRRSIRLALSSANREALEEG
jgi:hypothetical protein